MRRSFGLVSLLLLSISIAFSQSTFRGGLAGIVTDPQGAAIPGAKIEATDVATGLVYKAVASDAGDYSIPDLPLGDYNVTVMYPGFATAQIKLVRISAGAIFSLPVKLGISATTEVVEVDAAAVSLDTTTQERTFTLPKEEVTDIPINGRSFTQMTTFLPGNTTGTTQYLVDGVDNNDVYSESVGSNQGGVDGIPGTLLPLDSVEEYSAEQQTGAENGGFSGTTINLAIKSGTNKLHGTLYHYNRNEFFAEQGPFTKYSNAQRVAQGLAPYTAEIRLLETGGSIGGPIIKDRMFYFLNYERQQYILGQNTSLQTEPSTAYVTRALALLSAGGVTPSTNPTITMMQNLITALWQPGMLTGAATPGNWTPPPSASQHGYSNNFMMKFDQKLGSKNSLSERWYLGQGSQTAPLSTSQNPWYYQVAGERVDNLGVTLNTQTSSKSTNQVLLGVDYFNQPFTDAKPNGGATAVGFVAGVGPGNTYGQPGLAISGFDGTGGTSIQLRNDYSGHGTDTYSILLGKHQIRAGAEFRRLEIVEINTGRGSSSIYTRGTFSFSGNRGYNAASGGNGTSYPTSWPAGSPYTGTVDSQTKALADYLQGEGSSAQLYNGDLDRTAHSNNFNLFVQDSFQVTPNFNINYGLRWDFLTPIADSTKDLSAFRAGTPANSLDLTGGLAVIGNDISEAYSPIALQFAPRLGFSWQPTKFLPFITKGMVIRAAAGLYFDQPGPGTWLYATSLAGNPAGTRALYNETLTNENIQPNVSIFPSNAQASLPNNGAGGQCTGVKVATCPNLAIAGVDPHFSTGNTTNLSASVQKALGSSAMVEVSYVGAVGRHLANSLDLNQTTYGASTNTAISNGFTYQQVQRPYFGQYPNFAKITQAASFGSLWANALQAYIRTRNWHGLISEISYALSTSKGTGTIGDYNNPALDYGSSAVITNQVKGYWTYTIPGVKSGPSWLVNKWITSGWQTTGTLYFHGATALTASGSGSCNQSAATGNTYAITCSGLGIGEGAGRASLTGLPRFCPPGKSCGSTLPNGVTGTSKSAITNGFIQWYNPYSVISPPGCSTGAASFGPDCSLPLSSYYGKTKPGQIHGAPGFGTVDMSVIKDFPIRESVKVQFRGEMYNLFNRVNYAKPSLSSGNTAADLRYGGLNVSNASSTGQVTSTIGGSSDPGITEGEPFNVQFAAKIIF